MHAEWIVLVAVCLTGLPCLSAAESAAWAADGPAVDFRYAPADWQTCIGLPDDWQKTLVGKDGRLLYDYPDKSGGFGTRITAGLAGQTQWVKQELVSPRVPIVRTTGQQGALRCVQEAFAVTALPRADEPTLPMERVGSDTVLSGWAAPSVPCDDAFRDIAVGWKEPIAYRFKAEKSARYTVVFGLCEGHHALAGQRVLELQIEGQTRQTVDPVAEKGRNIPIPYSFDAADENGDGWIDLAVAAAANSPDQNTILNVLWVFPAGRCPPADEIVSGKANETALAYSASGSRPPRDDVLILQISNGGAADADAVPTLTIESVQPVRTEPDQRRVRIGSGTTLTCSEPFERADQSSQGTTLTFAAQPIPPGGNRTLAFGFHRGRGAGTMPASTKEAAGLRSSAEAFWQDLKLPYGHIEVPDAGVQALLDSAIRNIYQAREIKKGLPAFQVGPTCYRGLWVVDGSFILEAVTYLGRVEEARHGIEYLLSFQRDDGGFMLIDQHWKETGIVLWAVTRHARLTGDKEWLAQVWPRLERGFAFIRELRKQSAVNPVAHNAGLIPAGFSDGGLSGPAAEYTNVYWTLVGLRAAVEAARWLGHDAQAEDWQREYDDFYATFRRCAARDLHSDAHGNRYLPIPMIDGDKVLPQRAQWAFLHAVFPGQVFAPDDPLVLGNMAMLRAAESEGLVLTTGWLEDGIWNYFGSFYAHAWLWLGQRDRAIEAAYAFANHASPLLAWREEQKPVGRGAEMVGDMPHNWASAEFIRLVRHLLVLERGDELHLLEGLPATWVKPGAVTRLQDIQTEFGPLSLELRVDDDGRNVQLRLTAPARTPPRRIVLHQAGWSGRSETLDLPTTDTIVRSIPLAGGDRR